MEDSNFLFRLALNYSTTNEQLSRFYMLKFIQQIRTHEISLNAEILYQFCSHCYTVFVPGMNCTIEMVPKKKKNKETTNTKIINHVPALNSDLLLKKGDKLLYTCSKCSTTHVFPIAKPTKSAAKMVKKPKTTQKENKPTTTTTQKVKKQNKTQKNSVNDFLKNLKV